LAVGVGLFAWILRTADLPAVWKTLTALHWRFGMVLLFYIVIFGLDTLGWRYALRPHAQAKIRWDRLFRARLAGEAVNYVTPTAWVGGEPVKAALLAERYGIPMVDGMASVVVAKTTFALSMLLFIVLGLFVTLWTQPISPAVLKWVWVVLPFLLTLMVIFLLVQFFQPFRRGSAWMSKISPRWFSQLESKVHQWDEAITSFYRSSPSSIFWSTWFHFLGWVAGAVEVYLILWFLQLPVSFATACSIEALWLLLRSGAFMIPATIGASEGIVLFICSGLGIGAVPGLALALTRRARELTWVGLGLAEFGRRR